MENSFQPDQNQNILDFLSTGTLSQSPSEVELGRTTEDEDYYDQFANLNEINVIRGYDESSSSHSGSESETSSECSILSLLDKHLLIPQTFQVQDFDVLSERCSTSASGSRYNTRFPAGYGDGDSDSLTGLEYRNVCLDHDYGIPPIVPPPTPFEQFVPKGLVTYGRNYHLPCSTTSEFYIEMQDKNGIIPSFVFFDITVLSHSATKCSTSTAMDPENFNRYTCRFRTFEPGKYTATVFFRNMHGVNTQIPGSPLEFHVTRDYSRISKSIIKFGFDDNNITLLKLLCEGSYVNEAVGICSNPFNEQLFVTERLNNCVSVYTPEGYLIGKIGQGFNKPTGIAFDEVHSRIFVSDTNNHLVRCLSKDGQIAGLFGQKGERDSEALLYYPWAIAVARNGMFIAVADSLSRIQIFDNFGNLINSVPIPANNHLNLLSNTWTRNGQNFQNPVKGLHFDNDNKKLYFTDEYANQLFAIENKTGFMSLRKVEENSVMQMQLNRPRGMADDPYGNLLICEAGSSQIRVLSTQSSSDPEAIRQGPIRAIDYHPFMIPVDITALRGGFMALLEHNGKVRIF